MDKNKDYYKILEINRDATQKEIKFAYYGLSKRYHPDKNGDELLFHAINEAYLILSDADTRLEYDSSSRFGNSYNEYYELFEIDFDFSYENSKSQLEKFKKNEVLDIHLKVDDTFNGSITYERWVRCKTCDGSGKDHSSKIVIRDKDGKVLKTFDSDDGCDFCFEGHNKVITNKGPVSIKNIQVGDYVLSSNNIYNEVTHTMIKKYYGILYDISCSGINIEGITPNHKLNIVRFNRNKQGRIKINDYNILEVPACDLKIDDFVLYQKQSYIPKDILTINSVRNKISKLEKIVIDDDFIKFISCYIAEGNTRGNRVTVFTFHIEKDKELIDFIINYVKLTLKLDIKCFTRPESWGQYVLKMEIFNTQLSNFIREFCGHTAINKYINYDIIGKNDEKLLDTLILCDGSSKKKCKTYTTVSKKLAYQVLHLSLGLGHNASISKYPSYVDKNGVNHQIYYRVYITYRNDSSKMGLYNKKIKEGICLKIKSIENRTVELTDVYNITVKDTHKYTIDGLLVNNCDGTGKDYTGGDCNFCLGKGKVGLNPCKKCNGDRRILGKQKLSGIKLTGKETKIDAMGHCSKTETGKSGYLLLIKQE